MIYLFRLLVYDQGEGRGGGGLTVISLLGEDLGMRTSRKETVS